MILDLRRRHARDYIFCGDAIANCYSSYIARVLSAYSKKYHVTVAIGPSDATNEIYLNNLTGIDYDVIQSAADEFITKCKLESVHRFETIQWAYYVSWN